MIKVWNTLNEKKFGTSFTVLENILSYLETDNDPLRGIVFDKEKQQVQIPAHLIDYKTQEVLERGTFVVTVYVTTQEFEKRPMLEIGSFDFEKRK